MANLYQLSQKSRDNFIFKMFRFGVLVLIYGDHREHGANSCNFQVQG